MPLVEGASPRPIKRPEGERLVLTTARLPHQQNRVLVSLPADQIDVDVATAAIKKVDAWVTSWQVGREVISDPTGNRLSKLDASRIWARTFGEPKAKPILDHKGMCRRLAICGYKWTPSDFNFLAVTNAREALNERQTERLRALDTLAANWLRTQGPEVRP